MPEPSFLQRFKERKLVQWALAYLAGAFGVFQLLDALEGALGLTLTIQRAILVIVVIGFFIVLILAWYHGEKGRQRVSGPELLMVGALFVVAGVALSILPGKEAGVGSPEIAPLVGVDDDRPSIAVLPFDDFSPDPDDAYFADGMHEEVISTISKIASLRVISRNSVMKFREERSTTPEIAQELGVDFILEGSARVAGEQVRLTAQLIRARPEEHLWSHDYDQELSVENLISTQSDIAQGVAEAIGAMLTSEEEDRFHTSATENLEAYQDYLRGREALRRRSSSDIQAAFGFFQAALEEDDRFARAHAGIADAWIIRGWEEADTAYFRRGREAAERALDLDSLLAEAHVSKAYALFLGDWDWGRPEKSFQTAIRLDPNNSKAHHWYGEYLSAIGRVDAGVNETSVALASDPLAPAIVCDYGSALRYAGRIQEGVGFFERCLDLAPNWWGSYANLLIAYPEVGRETDALNVLDQIFRLFGSSEDLASWESLPEKDDFQVVLSRTLEFLEDGSGSESLFLRGTYFLAVLHLQAGQAEEAFRYLDSAVNERHPSFAKSAMVSPAYGSIRDDPRFQAFLQRMGLKE